MENAWITIMKFRRRSVGKYRKCKVWNEDIMRITEDRLPLLVMAWIPWGTRQIYSWEKDMNKEMNERQFAKYLFSKKKLGG